MSRYVSFRDFDWFLFIFVLIICALGVMEIRSATMHTKFAGAHIKQVYWVMGGIVAMFLTSLFNYQALLDKVHWMYIASIASLVGVILFGQKYLGARRWIKMPGGSAPSSRRRPCPGSAVTARKAGCLVSSSFLPAERNWPSASKASAARAFCSGVSVFWVAEPGERDPDGGHGGAEPLGGRGRGGGRSSGRSGQSRWSSKVVIGASSGW